MSRFFRGSAQTCAPVQIALTVSSMSSANFTGRAGNPSVCCDMSCSTMQGDPGGSKAGENPLTQTFTTMKSPRKQNSTAAGTVRTGIPFSADLGQEDALPRFHKQLVNDQSAPSEIPLPEEESFRAFLNSRLSKHKAPQALKERIRSSMESHDM